MKKTVILLLLVLFLPVAFGTISNLKIPPFIRLGENLTIAGNFTTAKVLCKFEILDSNGHRVERLSDEFTFDDGSFYAQRKTEEPPYYRGDDFNVFVTCGSSTDSNTFTVLQPLGITHSVQLGWEYWFNDANQDTIMLFVTFVLGGFGALILIAFMIKKGYDYAH